VVHTLGPWVERFEQACNRDILANDPELKVDLDERNLLRGDFKDQAEYYTKALGSGGQSAWLTVNEVREEVGLNPVSDAWANTVSRGAMDKGQDDGNQGA
jgi:phage portal protein BeeE